MNFHLSSQYRLDYLLHPFSASASKRKKFVCDLTHSRIFSHLCDHRSRNRSIRLVIEATLNPSKKHRIVRGQLRILPEVLREITVHDIPRFLVSGKMNQVRALASLAVFLKQLSRRHL